LAGGVLVSDLMTRDPGSCLTPASLVPESALVPDSALTALPAFVPASALVPESAVTVLPAFVPASALVPDCVLMLDSAFVPASAFVPTSPLTARVDASAFAGPSDLEAAGSNLVCPSFFATRVLESILVPVGSLLPPMCCAWAFVTRVADSDLALTTCVSPLTARVAASAFAAVTSDLVAAESALTGLVCLSPLLMRVLESDFAAVPCSRLWWRLSRT
jgi:hypothetical protein